LTEEDGSDTSNEEEDTSNEEVQLVAVGKRVLAEVSLPHGNIVSFPSILLALRFHCHHQECELLDRKFGKLLEERKDLEEMTEETNCHLRTFCNQVKHDWGLPCCDSLQHVEVWRWSSVKALTFPWKGCNMSCAMRWVLCNCWKELELQALSDSCEEECELAASAPEQELHEGEREKWTKMIEETNQGVDSCDSVFD
jgi:hypothetical protein